MTNKSLSLKELDRLGEKFYLNELKDKLEKDYLGQFVVIDVEQKRYVIDANELAALEKAEKEFGSKLFYIVEIGTLQGSDIHFSETQYAWPF